MLVFQYQKFRSLAFIFTGLFSIFILPILIYFNFYEEVVIGKDSTGLIFVFIFTGMSFLSGLVCLIYQWKFRLKELIIDTGSLTVKNVYISGKEKKFQVTKETEIKIFQSQHYIQLKDTTNNLKIRLVFENSTKIYEAFDKISRELNHQTT